jgi:RNA polymerase sigma-70 factor (ECF subfamily)
VKRQLRQAQNGDMDAFAALFEPLRARIYAVAFRLVGPDDAEDVVMDTYLKAWRALPRFAGRSSLSTWLCGIARNQSLDLLRRRQVRNRGRVANKDSEDRVAEVDDPTQTGPLDAMQSVEDQALCQRALAALPEMHRHALLLRYVDGLSYQEIAAALDISMGTTMSRLFNARRKLRQQVESLTANSPERIKETP